MKIALLSNVNMDPVNRLLKSVSGLEVYETQGYGNELGTLLNKEAPLYDFGPDMVFLIIDVMETIGHELNEQIAEDKIYEWFALFESSLQNDIIYNLSDAYVYGLEMGVVADKSIKLKIESIWSNHLGQLMKRHPNVRLFEYRELIESIGELQAFSKKMWYMGKILHSSEFHKVLAETIVHKKEIESSTPKKVLLLDLDNTLWRGLAGEHSNEPIVLSDDGIGLAYKNLQRVIRQMKMQGVILGIVSKNNKDDAMEIISNHPHMVLHESDFAVMKINWENKNDNIVKIAEELNLGLDAFVFFDDNPAERTLIKETIPEVIVPEFPKRPEELSDFMTNIYHRYFEKPVITNEDRKKTEQYQANQMRKSLQAQAVDFDSYLEGLEMSLIRISPKGHTDRLTQLMNKTNQFNLTTQRFSEQEVTAVIQDEKKEIFLYQVTDKFGDNGIVAAAIVDYEKDAVVSEFTMSCRVMGRHIENAIVEDMENAARNRGYGTLTGVYKPTEKNKPVENLYLSLGYEEREKKDDGSIYYSIELSQSLTRHYRLTKSNEED